MNDTDMREKSRKITRALYSMYGACGKLKIVGLTEIRSSQRDTVERIIFETIKILESKK